MLPKYVFLSFARLYFFPTHRAFYLGHAMYFCYHYVKILEPPLYGVPNFVEPCKICVRGQYVTCQLIIKKVSPFFFCRQKKKKRKIKIQKSTQDSLETHVAGIIILETSEPFIADHGRLCWPNHLLSPKG